MYGQEYYEYSDSGSITPPYQENGLYDYNVFVVWTIMADTGKEISKNFLYIDVEGSKAVCYADVIYVS